MLVIVNHNEHAFDNSASVQIIGPFLTKESAIERLRVLQAEMADPLFKLDEEAGFLGYDYEELEAAGRNGALSSEIWAEIVELTV